jgi:hypothetical protein
MAKKKAPEFKLGDEVRIRHSEYQGARIVELRGPLGPGGVEIYRVRVKGTQGRVYIELRGDQLELIPQKADTRAEGKTMAKKKPGPQFKLGDRVRLIGSGYGPGWIEELRGPLAPGGRQVYGIRVTGTRKPLYLEVTGDQLELIPSES